MPAKNDIANTHALYDDKANVWQRARDVVAGEDKVKAAGTDYLPRLEDQTNDEYNAYKMRAEFFNATARTLEGLVGMIFRKDPEVKLPEGGATGTALQEFANDCDLKGTTLYGYVKKIMREIMGVGRAGTLIDWESEGEDRVYLSKYCAEDILNWRTERVNGRMMLTMLTLHECVEPPDGQGYNLAGDNPLQKVYPGTQKTEPKRPDTIEQIRRFRLLQTPTTAVDGEAAPPAVRQCVVEVWQLLPKQGKNKSSTLEWQLIETVRPTRRNIFLGAIPFVFHGPHNSQPEPDKPPLDDLALVNLSHYRKSADYHHGLHFTGLPTAWVAGFPPESKLRIGSTTAWVSSETGAKAGYLEFTGQGLGALVTAMEKDELYMTILGARLLEQQKRDAETAETLRIRQSGEAATLIDASVSVSESMTQVLKWCAWWNGTEEAPEKIDSEQVGIELNSEFVSLEMPPQQIQALVAAWTMRAISHNTVLHNLREADMLPPGITDEAEQALIEAETPPTLPAPRVVPGQGQGQ